MKPGEIKLYGLFPITKKRYIFSMLFSFVVVGLSIGWARFKLDLPFPWEDKPFPKALGEIWVARNFYWLVLGGLLLGLVDSIFVFRRFARATAQEPPSARAFLK
jgi:hypothetical protein